MKRGFTKQIQRLTRSEQTLGLQSSQRFKACPADPDDTIFGLRFPTPATDSQVQADPSLKEKAWDLTWMPLAFLARQRTTTHSSSPVPIDTSPRILHSLFFGCRYGSHLVERDLHGTFIPKECGAVCYMALQSVPVCSKCGVVCCKSKPHIKSALLPIT